MTSEVETAGLLPALVYMYGTWWPVVIGFFYLNSFKSIPMYLRRQALPPLYGSFLQILFHAFSLASYFPA